MVEREIEKEEREKREWVNVEKKTYTRGTKNKGGQSLHQSAKQKIKCRHNKTKEAFPYPFARLLRLKERHNVLILERGQFGAQTAFQRAHLCAVRCRRRRRETTNRDGEWQECGKRKKKIKTIKQEKHRW